MAIKRPWPPGVSQEFRGVNWCPVPTPRDWVPPVRAHAPHGPCGRQCLCSWGFCRRPGPQEGGCSTLPLGPCGRGTRQAGPQAPRDGEVPRGPGAASLEPFYRGLRAKSPALAPWLAGPHLQGLKAELWPQALGPFFWVGASPASHQCSALTPDVAPRVQPTWRLLETAPPQNDRRFWGQECLRRPPWCRPSG